VTLGLAVKAATDANIVFVTSAGNQEKDACTLSAFNLPSAIIVGASNIDDQIASFSNYGKCVDIFAPGVDVASTCLSKDSRDKAIPNMCFKSGTSMSSPHVAGVVSLALSKTGYVDVQQVKNDVIRRSTRRKVSFTRSDGEIDLVDKSIDTRNRLIFKFA
jgi:cerevisin